MSLNNFFDDGQSQTGSSFVFSSGQICFVESCPDFFDAVGRDADTGVFDGDEYFFVLDARLNRDIGIVMRKFHCVVHQIVQYLLDFAHIGGDQKLLPGKQQVEGDALFAAGTLEGKDGGPYHLIDIKIRDVEHDAVLSKPVQIQKALCQLVQALGFEQDDV